MRRARSSPGCDGTRRACNLAGVNNWDAASPDVLGEPFSAITLSLGSDFEGPVSATLVRSAAPAGSPARGAVLYLPGYNDYFFQRHVAEFWNGLGFGFYALDPRKAGRSCQPTQTRNLCRHLSDYFPEIDRAAEIIRSSLGDGPLVLCGHSTGGLLASVWLSQRPSGADGLVLNSPFLTTSAPLPLQAVMNPVLGFIADRRPAAAFPGRTAGVYARGLHSDHGGPWTFDPAWKSTSGTRLRLGWLAGVHEAQRAVRRGLGISVPVLALFGDRDIVMDTKANAALAARLGTDVTCERIPGALHDVTLSDEAVREQAFSVLTKWLNSADFA